jgi:hypothetical protein
MLTSALPILSSMLVLKRAYIQSLLVGTGVMVHLALFRSQRLGTWAQDLPYLNKILVLGDLIVRRSFQRLQADEERSAQKRLEDKSTQSTRCLCPYWDGLPEWSLGLGMLLGNSIRPIDGLGVCEY